MDYVKGHEKSEMFRSCMNKITTYFPTYKSALKRAKIIFSSNDETSQCIERRLGSSPTMKTKLHQMTELCVDDAYLLDRMALSKSKNSTVHIVVSGRLIYRKGIQVLLEAISLMKAKNKFVVDIYGEGDQRTILEKYVQKTDLSDKVIFHGKIPFEEMQRCYMDADIYVLPSLRESTGTAVFEAMANKLPVVTFNQNGAKHIVENDAGILINLNSKEQVLKDLALALDRLVDDYTLRVKMGSCGFEKLTNKYTWSRRAEYMSEIYANLVEER